MKDLVYNVPIGKQIRYVNPEYHELKSKTAYGSKIGYFYDDTKLKKQLPIIILEGEKDRATGWFLWWNCVWLQGVHNLNKLVNILYMKWYKRILICVDQDEAADRAISKVEKRDVCWDIRWVLWDYKDLSDAYISKKNLAYYYKEIIPQNNLLEKLWPYNYTKPKLPKEPSADFSSIPTDLILESLYPQYKVAGDRIYENWKLLSWYRYWKSTNIIKDFSEKDRPEGNAWKVAYKYYQDKKATYEYLKRFVT